jgi:peptidoglycan LD-endopeptidase LytH
MGLLLVLLTGGCLMAAGRMNGRAEAGSDRPCARGTQTARGEKLDTAPDAAFIDATLRGITRRIFTQKEARSRMESCAAQLRAWRRTVSIESAIAFPVEGAGCSAIGGAGKGYRGAGGYSFYSGNAHGGHPSHDIFIPDRDQDCLHDRTKAPVRVLAVRGGFVASVTPHWSADSLDAKGAVLRGGICVWIYDPVADGFWYYAHLHDVAVVPGQVVSSDAPIGTVGRTGKNAAPSRSPTHLHLTLLTLQGSDPVPADPYTLLCGKGKK